MSITIVVTDVYTLKADLARMGDKMRAAALEVMYQQCGLIRDLAKIYVRVDTGSLRDSIRLERGGPGRDTMRVRAGGYVVNPNTGRLVDYAAAVEAKYPFFQPAIASVRPMIREMIKAGVVEACRT